VLDQLYWHDPDGMGLMEWHEQINRINGRLSKT
jgi:hypothetical protein